MAGPGRMIPAGRPTFTHARVGGQKATARPMTSGIGTSGGLHSRVPSRKCQPLQVPIRLVLSGTERGTGDCDRPSLLRQERRRGGGMARESPPRSGQRRDPRLGIRSFGGEDRARITTMPTQAAHVRCLGGATGTAEASDRESTRQASFHLGGARRRELRAERGALRMAAPARRWSAISLSPDSLRGAAPPGLRPACDSASESGPWGMATTATSRHASSRAPRPSGPGRMTWHGCQAQRPLGSPEQSAPRQANRRQRRTVHRNAASAAMPRIRSRSAIHEDHALEGRKPMGAASREARQRAWMQRTRRWMKALRSVVPDAGRPVR